MLDRATSHPRSQQALGLDYSTDCNGLMQNPFQQGQASYKGMGLPLASAYCQHARRAAAPRARNQSQTANSCIMLTSQRYLIQWIQPMIMLAGHGRERHFVIRGASLI